MFMPEEYFEKVNKRREKWRNRYESCRSTLDHERLKHVKLREKVIDLIEKGVLDLCPGKEWKNSD